MNRSHFFVLHILCKEKGLSRLINMMPIVIEDKTFIGISVQLPKTTLLSISSDCGYIMCGALDVGLLNTKLKERKIIAGRAVGVRTIEELLNAPLEIVTDEAERIGITAGMIGKDALLKMIDVVNDLG